MRALLSAKRCCRSTGTSQDDQQQLILLYGLAEEKNGNNEPAGDMKTVAMLYHHEANVRDAKLKESIDVFLSRRNDQKENLDQFEKASNLCTTEMDITMLRVLLNLDVKHRKEHNENMRNEGQSDVGSAVGLGV
ncbi:hypothetical protein L2E82_26188 [Cichorium intybus]|uniref:Uncharacterized protein n=1 Tax=Cichorium intybus TaxID=13427 RepID=A0ACB9E5T1_CICIN|nr:hypothetical protein L2E82_26188 [Cichorium intybus]